MRVRFGTGMRTELPDELGVLDLNSAIVLCAPGQVELGHNVHSILGDAGRGVYPYAEMHVPLTRAEAARAFAEQRGADAVVCVGGGSTTGLGKAIALTSGLPVIAVPTTYAGSEMTPIWGLTDQAVKKTGRDARVLPRSVIYDPELTYSLPVNISVTSGFNAIAHAAEALYAPDASPIISLMAEEGARTMLSALPALRAEPADAQGRSEALYAAWLCGAVLGSTTMGLHHKLCHILGGTFNLPHADTHTIVLPYVLAFNLVAAPQARAALARATGTETPAATIKKIADSLGAPPSLQSIGMPAAGIAEVVRQAVDAPYSNPRPVTAEQLTALITDAHIGTHPRELDI
ncbi:Maleylacetate reductase [Mycolicibacterium wolinskyi]|uniref:Maleylacetate reductase n=2 Tax=Mycolicibacterium wolinskyi TaxID=59750 RepID=A0A132PTL9_9MYCO|nr:Maleylacetate reductase [Mycolicibacterium wolinskyi]